MYDVWRVMWFPVPKIELSRQPSDIMFLMRNWYYLIWYYNDSWKFIEFSENEKIRKEKELLEANEEQNITYVLKKS